MYGLLYMLRGLESMRGGNGAKYLTVGSRTDRRLTFCKLPKSKQKSATPAEAITCAGLWGPGDWRCLGPARCFVAETRSPLPSSPKNPAELSLLRARCGGPPRIPCSGQGFQLKLTHPGNSKFKIQNSKSPSLRPSCPLTKTPRKLARVFGELASGLLSVATKKRPGCGTDKLIQRRDSWRK
jgi:hypothetical protein